MLAILYISLVMMSAHALVFNSRMRFQNLYRTGIVSNQGSSISKNDHVKLFQVSTTGSISDSDSFENAMEGGTTQQKQLPTYDDMKILATLLANITDHIDTKPDIAFSIASSNMGWLYSRDVPKLTQMMLNEFPALRNDDGMMRSYCFVLDFLEAVVKETSTMLYKNRRTLKLILEAAKISEQEVDRQMNLLLEDIVKPEFMVYLDSEIEGQETNGPMENLLVTIKLRTMDEIGKRLGVDVTRIPIIASEEDPAEMRKKAIQHLQTYDKAGVELFLLVLGMLRVEMKKRYTAVDPLLSMNLGEIEKIAKSYLKGLSGSETKA